MGIIQILDDHIANQIAAGEVVERPSSVVKELVENAIDAGSTRIDVHIEEGGLQLIRVTDNGSGIQSEDVETAFQRHATSKIKNGRDLFQIRSLGFRGEALPSIAAVARVELLTSTVSSGLGRKLIVEGGKLSRHEEAAASKGTDLQVKDLFYNTPARLKYMKTIQTELGHVSDYMYRLALGRPDISFTLKHHNNVLLRTLGNGDLLQVIAAIYGTATAKSMIKVEADSLDYKVTGYVSRPELTRANRYGISMVVNGRYIRNYALAGALLQAYHTLLPVHRFPLSVLHISMEPELIDVNVHPSKLEVRFSKEPELVRFLTDTVKNVLEEQTLIPRAGISTPSRPKPAQVQEQLRLYEVEKDNDESPDSSPATNEDRPSEPYTTSTSSRPAPPTVVPPALQDKPQGWRSTERATGQESALSFQRPATKVSSREREEEALDPAVVRGFMVGLQKPVDSEDVSRQVAASTAEASKTPTGEVPATEPSRTASANRMPKLHPIGQMRSTYIVAQNEDGLYLIDQHAAHERLNYEFYYEKFGKPESASQELLLPLTLEFTAVEAAQLQERLAYFQQVGVYMEPFGGNTFKVTAYPHWFPSGEEKSIIEEMSEWVLQEKKAPDLAKLREKSSILCSCKASIKANQALSLAEMERLLERLQQARNPFTCPHGRPIIVSFSNYELEKMFKRVM